jgi:hypothetical protein
MPVNGAETLQCLFVDFTGARLFYETGSSSPRYAWRSQTIINGGKGYRINLGSRTVSPINAPSLNDFRAQFQKLPQFLLDEVLTERAASLRWLGESAMDEQRHAVITFIDPDHRQVALYFDTWTMLLSRYEYLLSDPVVGDTKAEFVSIKEGLLDATWFDPEGTGRIIFGFTSDLSQFGAFFNTH